LRGGWPVTHRPAARVPAAQTVLSIASHALPCILAAGLAALSVGSGARASEFAVSPVRAELRAGALSETITVSNLGSTRLRIGVKLMQWTQDAQGQDVYTETTDLVYFPRQMELEPQGRRLVRVGANAPAGATERAYRLFIEEQPQAAADAARAQVSVYFRFGVPVFLAPAALRPLPEFGEPTLERGTLWLPVRNAGNRHFRLLRLVVRDDAGFSQEIAGWYSLAGTQRSYSMALPPAVCRQGRTLSIAIEGEGLKAERKLHVDPARCS
jgi:fimbrial chaperone protein